MSEKIIIYATKFFSRMRNKAQLFSSLTDDHYHTRLIHSMEVLEIARMIQKNLRKKYPRNKLVKKINFDILEKISLFHDIGHTPYGHVGERTLNEICSGECQIRGLPDFKQMHIECGFKHNINSGILYKEHLIKNNKKITIQDCVIIDGITKHSALFFKKHKNLDYGLGYINSGLKKQINFVTKEPLSIEGFIVSFADEIAQMFSDYLDLYTAKSNLNGINLLAPFVANSKNKTAEEIAKGAVDYMVNQFVSSFSIRKMSYDTMMKSNFGLELNKFSEQRNKAIKSNEKIFAHDFIKKRHIIILFKHYFLCPSDSSELFDDFQHRVMRMKLGSIKLEVENMNISNFDKFIYKCLRIATRSKNKNELRKYKFIMKVFIMSVAIYISKMTDNYADHKIRSIC